MVSYCSLVLSETEAIIDGVYIFDPRVAADEVSLFSLARRRTLISKARSCCLNFTQQFLFPSLLFSLSYPYIADYMSLRLCVFAYTGLPSHCMHRSEPFMENLLALAFVISVHP